MLLSRHLLLPACRALQGNPLRLPPGPYLRNLEELCLEWNALFLGSALLAAAASRLSRLYLSGTHSLRDDGAAVAPPAVARALAACPALTRFVDVLEEGSGEALDVEVRRRLWGSGAGGAGEEALAHSRKLCTAGRCVLHSGRSCRHCRACAALVLLLNAASLRMHTAPRPPPAGRSAHVPAARGLPAPLCHRHR